MALHPYTKSIEGQEILPIDFEPSPQDVLCGRGKACWKHPGNQRFTEVIRDNLSTYTELPRRGQKSNLVTKVVEKLRSTGGRFIKKDNATNRYYLLNQRQAHEKTGHAMRDLLKTKGDHQPSRKPKKVKSSKKQPRKSAAAIHQKRLDCRELEDMSCTQDFKTVAQMTRIAKTKSQSSQVVSCGLPTTNLDAQGGNQTDIMKNLMRFSDQMRTGDFLQDPFFSLRLFSANEEGGDLGKIPSWQNPVSVDPTALLLEPQQELQQLQQLQQQQQTHRFQQQQLYLHQQQQQQNVQQQQEQQAPLPVSSLCEASTMENADLCQVFEILSDGM